MKYMITLVVLLASCSSNPASEVKPDPSGASSGDVSSGSASSSSGTSGGGGSSGLSCDPCENKDGTRIVRERNVTKSQDGLFYASTSSGLFYDTLLKSRCFAAPSSDGTTRCLPFGFSTLFFSDSTCSSSLISFGQCEQVKSITSVAVSGPSGTCGTGYYEPYMIGSEYIGDVYWNQGGTCKLYVVTTNKYFNATKMNASDFVPMTYESQ
jgi:hypothetical protein